MSAFDSCHLTPSDPAPYAPLCTLKWPRLPDLINCNSLLVSNVLWRCSHSFMPPLFNLLFWICLYVYMLPKFISAAYSLYISNFSTVTYSIKAWRNKQILPLFWLISSPLWLDDNLWFRDLQQNQCFVSTFKSMRTWGGKWQITDLGNLCSQSQVRVASSSDLSQPEFLNCHLRGISKIFNSELFHFNNLSKFQLFYIIFSSLSVRKKFPLEIYTALRWGFFADNFLNTHTHIISLLDNNGSLRSCRNQL